jgi:hypothetical protein
MSYRDYSKWKNVLTDEEIESLPNAEMRLTARISRDEYIDNRIQERRVRIILVVVVGITLLIAYLLK